MEAHESTRKRVESTLPGSHEDHIAEKGFHSESRNNLVLKCVPIPHAMKTSVAKAAVDKEWQKLEKLPAWQGEEQKKKKRVILEEHRGGKKKVHSVSLMDTCHLKNAELKPKHQKYKG